MCRVPRALSRVAVADIARLGHEETIAYRISMANNYNNNK